MTHIENLRKQHTHAIKELDRIRTALTVEILKLRTGGLDKELFIEYMSCVAPEADIEFDIDYYYDTNLIIQAYADFDEELVTRFYKDVEFIDVHGYSSTTSFMYKITPTL